MQWASVHQPVETSPPHILVHFLRNKSLVCPNLRLLFLFVWLFLCWFFFSFPHRTMQISSLVPRSESWPKIPGTSWNWLLLPIKWVLWSCMGVFLQGSGHKRKKKKQISENTCHDIKTDLIQSNLFTGFSYKHACHYCRKRQYLCPLILSSSLSFSPLSHFFPFPSLLRSFALACPTASLFLSPAVWSPPHADADSPFFFFSVPLFLPALSPYHLPFCTLCPFVNPPSHLHLPPPPTPQPAAASHSAVL